MAYRCSAAARISPRRVMIHSLVWSPTVCRPEFPAARGGDPTLLRPGLGEKPDGRWAADEVGIVVPRQDGKGAIFEARELARAGRQGQARQGRA